MLIASAQQAKPTSWASLLQAVNLFATAGGEADAPAFFVFYGMLPCFYSFVNPYFYNFFFHFVYPADLRQHYHRTQCTEGGVLMDNYKNAKNSKGSQSRNANTKNAKNTKDENARSENTRNETNAR